MPIKTLKGMIMDVASSNSEAIAVWMYYGFNTRCAIWESELQKRGINLRLVYPTDKNVIPNCLDAASNPYLSNYPWRLNHETLWHFTNQTEHKLKYLYVFPNPLDKQRLDNLEEIDRLLNKCLDILKQENINSVSFILIPALPRGLFNEKEDIVSAERMIACIQNWLTKNNSSIDVFLVDRLDSFRPILENLNH